jgi:DNA-binding MarR family transcriptional regulator
MEHLPCACATARQVARALTQFYDDRLRGTGIESPQLALLMSLDSQGPCTQIELAGRYGFDKTTVSRNLKLLQTHGLIRSTVLEDKRKRHLSLTAAGRKVLAVARPRWQAAQNELRLRMTEPQWDAMFQAFSIVLDTAGEAFSVSEETAPPTTAGGLKRPRG